MTLILVGVLALLAIYGVYLASLNARISLSPSEFIDGGQNLAPWTYMFAGAGVMIAGIGLQDHLVLAARFGLQYSHIALGLVVAAMASAVVQKRFRKSAQLLETASPAAILGRYFGSVTIRLFVVLVVCLFGLPFAADKLSQIADVMSDATGGAASRIGAIWVFAFVLFLTSVIGGWRGTVLVIAGSSFLMIVGMVFVGGFAAATLDKLAYLSGGIATAKTILPDQIPGVMQYSSGIGKGVTQGGIWTALSISSFSLSIVGLVLSPAMLFLGNMTETKTGFAFKQVWMVAGVAAGLLLLLTPFLAAEIAAGGRGYQGLVDRLSSIDLAVGICTLLLIIVAAQIAIGFFATSAAMIVTSDVVHPYIVPDLTPSGQRYSARIVLAVFYLGIALMATVVPLYTAVLTSVTMSLSVQLLPALLAVCWIPWISRSAIICGLIIGSILSVFTEPLGLILFEAPFTDLPWGRWPLTIHSAAWGLVFNFSAVLLVSIFTRAHEGRSARDRLHRAFAATSTSVGGRPTIRTAKWSLAFLWAFFAIGPGAVLGNTFFSQAIFTSGVTALGVPSLWAWQLFFWFLGVLLIWWIAYRGEASLADIGRANPLRFDEDTGFDSVRRPPNWIGQGLARIAGGRRRR